MREAWREDASFERNLEAAILAKDSRLHRIKHNSPHGHELLASNGEAILACARNLEAGFVEFICSRASQDGCLSRKCSGSRGKSQGRRHTKPRPGHCRSWSERGNPARSVRLRRSGAAPAQHWGSERENPQRVSDRYARSTRARLRASTHTFPTSQWLTHISRNAGHRDGLCNNCARTPCCRSSKREADSPKC